MEARGRALVAPPSQGVPSVAPETDPFATLRAPRAAIPWDRPAQAPRDAVTERVWIGADPHGLGFEVAVASWSGANPPTHSTRQRKRAGWPKGRTPHFMRHFAASNLIRQGYGTKDACQILGHTTLRTFEETYAHVLRESRTGVRLSEAIAGLN